MFFLLLKSRLINKFKFNMKLNYMDINFILYLL